MNRSRCKVCKFLREHAFAKAQFDNEKHKALSLKELQTVLRVLGLDASKSTISRHLTQCEGLKLFETKTTKIKKAIKRPFKKFNFFIKPIVEIPSTCKHERVRHSFDHNYWDRKADGLVWIVCLDCNEVVMKYDPDTERNRKRPRRDLTIINALRKKQR